MDVGGGLGHDLVEFKTKHSDTNPNVRGRLILQDKSDVIAQIVPETAIGLELCAHDFFTEQPVRGKSFYLSSYKSTIAHNYLCTKIEQMKTSRRSQLTIFAPRGESLLLALGLSRLG